MNFKLINLELGMDLKITVISALTVTVVVEKQRKEVDSVGHIGKRNS